MRRLTIFTLCLLGGCLAGCTSMKASIGIDRVGVGYGLVFQVEMSVQDRPTEPLPP